ncbi:MAG: conjugative transposon protein TraM [Prevotellaceae bacterium]|jgi:conjugative transposon TraM protein|nr:conjugative transposon protein TraM [Prevotellaceae bacterium]
MEMKINEKWKQNLKKYAVFFLMGIICLGCLWLIFEPSDTKKLAGFSGFNSDVPLPKNDEILDDKASAYEREIFQKKQEERMKTMADFSDLIDNQTIDNEQISIDILPKTDEKKKAKSSIKSSVAAYQNVHKTLGSFYETSNNDNENERLKKEISELKEKNNSENNTQNIVNQQLEVMEKSYQIAAKYLPIGANNPSENIENQRKNGKKTAVFAVSQITDQTVSSLQKNGFNNAKNAFFDAEKSDYQQSKNTVTACIDGNQTIMSGQNVRLRLLEKVRAGNMVIDENSVITGVAKIENERLVIVVNSLEFNQNIIPVELIAFGLDGQKGIYIPDTKEVNAAKEIAANLGSNVSQGITISTDAAGQLAADMGKSVIQGTSQFISKKLSEVKIHLKAGFKIYLINSENN